MPALPLPPPPTTSSSTFVMSEGTVHVQFPIVEKTRSVSPLTDEVVGEHAAAFAVEESATWLGIATKSESTKTQEIEVGRNLRRIAYVRRRISKITFTSLFSINCERPKRKSRVIGYPCKSADRGEVHPQRPPIVG